MENTDNQGSVSLEHALSVLRRRAWVIAVCFLATTAAAFGFSQLQAKKYTATAQLLFNDTTVAQQASGLPVSPQTDPQGQRATDLTLVQLDNAVAQRTAFALNANITPKQVKDALAATNDTQSNVVSVSATWTSPMLATRIANTFARQFVRQQQRESRAGIQNAISLVQQQYNALTPSERRTSQGQSLIDHIESLKILRAMQNETQLAQPATIPRSPSSPKVLRNTAIGAVLGLCLGLGFAFLLDKLDRRLRDPSDVEQALGLPMLGLIPHGLKGAGADRGSGTIDLEPFRILRAHLRYFNVDRRLQTLLITSAQPAEGKTTTARGLAAAAVSMGTKTLLLEADLRRPALVRVLALRPGIGLAGALVAGGSPEGAIQHVDVDAGVTRGPGLRRLDVIAAGAIPPNPTELLESHAMEELMAWAKSQYELIIVDSAPLSGVADSIPLLKRVDGVIVVSRLGLSTRDTSERFRDRLNNLAAPLLGVVVNDARDRGGDYYGYGQAPGYGADQPALLTQPGPVQHPQEALASAASYPSDG